MQSNIWVHRQEYNVRVQRQQSTVLVRRKEKNSGIFNWQEQFNLEASWEKTACSPRTAEAEVQP